MMIWKEYREIRDFELYGHFNRRPKLIQRIIIKHFRPNTNCMYLARKMWFFGKWGD